MRIIEIPGHAPKPSSKISTDAVKQAIKESGIEYVVTLPESSIELLLRQLLQDDSVKVIQVSRECEGMGICSGLTYGGKRSTLLCTYKGLYNSIDSLIGVAMHTQISFLVLISEAPVSPEKAVHDPERGHHSAALLKALEIPFYEVRSTEEVPIIKEAVAKTVNNTQPVAVILCW